MWRKFYNELRGIAMKKRKRIHASLLCVCMAFSAQSMPVLAADATNCVHTHTEECAEVCEHSCSEESGCLTQELVREQEDLENAGALPGEGAMMEEGQSQTPEQSSEGAAAAPAAANAPDAATNEPEGTAAPAGEEPQEMANAPQSLALENAETEPPVNAPVLLENAPGEVADETALTKALADSSIDKITLAGDIDISSILGVSRAVKLDLNGHVLKMTSSGNVFKVGSGGVLTITDSNLSKEHRFTPNADGLWVLDEANGTETVSGGVITGGDANNGGGVCVAAEGKLILEGGNIVGCQAKFGGGVGVYGDISGAKINETTFTMRGGSITGCLATTSEGGGGVNVAYGTFALDGGSIFACAVHTYDHAYGGGVHVMNKSSFIMSGGEIKDCWCISGSWVLGGGVYVTSQCEFTMSGGSITGCECKTTDSNYPDYAQGGGVYNNGTFKMSSGSIQNNRATSGQGGDVCNDGTLYADGGEITGEVVNGAPNSGTITGNGSGDTIFSGKVINNKNGSSSISTIENGRFTGEVENNGGEISGGDFLGKVTNTGGTITGGTFSQQPQGFESCAVTFCYGNDEADVTRYAIKNAKISQPSPDPTRTGYSFDGWYADGSSQKFDFRMPIAADITLTAKWNAIDYAVNVSSSDGGTASASKGTANAGNSVTLTATPDEGYQFKKWEVTPGSVSIQNNSFTMPASNVEIKAIFEKKPNSGGGSGGGSGRTYHKMTFETNGGSTIRGLSAARGDVIDLTRYDPTREGYEFIGWFADAALTQKITEIKLTGNVTVYAGWREIEPVDPETPIEPENPEISNPFADVREENWFYDDVLFAYEQRILSGMSADTFAPQAASTRAQIAAIFYRMDGSPAVEGSNSFADVAQSAWFYDAVTWAEQNGILNGYGNGSFGANDSVTREQLAAIFYRYAQFKGLDMKNAGDLEAFADKNDASDWAQTALAWAVENGILSGKGDNRLDPEGTATRAELAAMLHRFAENIA